MVGQLTTLARSSFSGQLHLRRTIRRSRCGRLSSRSARGVLAKENEMSNDELMVVVVDGVHVSIFRTYTRLWLGLPRMGAALSKVFPATSSATGRGQR